MGQQYYTPKEVAKTLKVSVPTVHRWIEAGKLEAVQVERVVRITARSLDALLNQSLIGGSDSQGSEDSDTITIPRFTAA